MPTKYNTLQNKFNKNPADLQKETDYFFPKHLQSCLVMTSLASICE